MSEDYKIALITTLVTILILGVIVIINFIISYRLEKKFKQRFPYKKPYKWGFFIGCASISNLVFSLPLLISIPKGGEEAVLAISFLIYSGMVAFFGYKIIKRKKWSWILGTIMSLNPILFIINWIYARNRWDEFTQEYSEINQFVIDRNVNSTDFEDGEYVTVKPVCPNCMMEIILGSRFCSHCGWKIYEIKVNNEVNEKTIKCPMCAESIKADAKKCRYCGELINNLNGKIDNINRIHSNDYSDDNEEDSFSTKLKKLEQRTVNQIKEFHSSKKHIK